MLTTVRYSHSPFMTPTTLQLPHILPCTWPQHTHTVIQHSYWRLGNNFTADTHVWVIRAHKRESNDFLSTITTKEEEIRGKIVIKFIYEDHSETPKGEKLTVSD